MSNDKTFPDGVPEVYIQWRKQALVSVKGTLLVAGGAKEVRTEAYKESAAMAAKLDESII